MQHFFFCDGFFVTYISLAIFHYNNIIIIRWSYPKNIKWFDISTRSGKVSSSVILFWSFIQNRLNKEIINRFNKIFNTPICVVRVPKDTQGAKYVRHFFKVFIHFQVYMTDNTHKKVKEIGLWHLDTYFAHFGK